MLCCHFTILRCTPILQLKPTGPGAAPTSRPVPSPKIAPTPSPALMPDLPILLPMSDAPSPSVKVDIEVEKPIVPEEIEGGGEITVDANVVEGAVGGLAVNWMLMIFCGIMTFLI